MKKIGILTFHNSDNYGSVLQAYAMNKVIDNYGFLSETIDFHPKGQKELYSIFKKKINMKNIGKNILSLLFYRLLKNRKKEFDAFRRDKLNISANEYIEALSGKELEENYQMIICGSDQIWNVKAIDFSEEYLLPNVTKVRKIAYGPSLATGDFCSSKEKEHYKKLLEDFDFISVREASGKEKIEKLLNKEKSVEVVLDPTLLLEGEDYETLNLKRRFKEKYIFFYSTDFNPLGVHIINKIRGRYKLPVIVMYTSSKTFTVINKGFKISKYESPADFLSLIKNAEVVFTTSFHGTAFSIIFKKKFYSIMQEEKDGRIDYDPRIENLLVKLGLEDRIITRLNYQTTSYDEGIDYDDVYQKKDVLLKESYDYLEKALKKD